MEFRCNLWRVFGPLVLVLGMAVSSVTGGTTFPPIRCQVVIESGAPDAVRTMLQERLTAVMNSFGEPDSVAKHFTESGYLCFTNLLETTRFRVVNALYEPRIACLPLGAFELRGLRVRVDMGSTAGNPDQYLVFTTDSKLQITEVRFAIEEHHYESILEDGLRLQDLGNRQRILHFVEIFRTAYNRKDIEYLRQAYSDDALIIVGRKLEKSPIQSDLLDNSLLSRDQIVFIQRSKGEYLEKLEQVFEKSDFLDIGFEELEILRHHAISDIYGVTLKQEWRSSSYSDEGYLFLMIDFNDVAKPLVHVRTWQPERFQDSSTINLYDFNIIDN